MAISLSRRSLLAGAALAASLPAAPSVFAKIEEKLFLAAMKPSIGRRRLDAHMLGPDAPKGGRVEEAPAVGFDRFVGERWIAIEAEGLEKASLFVEIRHFDGTAFDEKRLIVDVEGARDDACMIDDAKRHAAVLP